jgi:hypothetical protein
VSVFGIPEPESPVFRRFFGGESPRVTEIVVGFPADLAGGLYHFIVNIIVNYIQRTNLNGQLLIVVCILIINNKFPFFGFPFFFYSE